MADRNAIRIKGRDCLNGQPRFFVPAGFTLEKGNAMTDVIPIEGARKRNATDAYDDLSLKLGHLKAIADLVAAANSDAIEVDDLNVAGYAMGYMIDDIAELARETHQLGGAK